MASFGYANTRAFSISQAGARRCPSADDDDAPEPVRVTNTPERLATIDAAEVFVGLRFL